MEFVHLTIYIHGQDFDGLFADCVGIMGIFPGDRKGRMTEALLNVERICASFQEKGVGAACGSRTMA